MGNEILLSKELLKDTGISILDAARLIRGVLDFMPESEKKFPIRFCSKVIDIGKRHIRRHEMNIRDGFELYLQSKCNLRPDSFKDLRYLGNRIIRSNPNFAKRNFSELSVSDCKGCLALEFSTPSQFNKARAMLHGLFEFALRREWCDKNPIKLIEKCKIFEKEIKPLSYSQTQKLLETSRIYRNMECMPAVGLLMLAGIRPKEVFRLTWGDIDLEENFVVVRSQCSKTGGVRHVEICPALKKLLEAYKYRNINKKICPKNWRKKWKNIRDTSGFKNIWIQDVLRHTYASFHAKYFHDLPRLQLNMGHRDQYLLQSRYINMGHISGNEAKAFFNRKYCKNTI